MLHVICTRMRLGHLSVRVGDSLRHSEEIYVMSHVCPSSRPSQTGRRGGVVLFQKHAKLISGIDLAYTVVCAAILR